MYQKNSIFAPSNNLIGHLTSEFIPGFFYARRYAAYNPVPTLNGLVSPIRDLTAGSVRRYFFVHMSKSN